MSWLRQSLTAVASSGPIKRLITSAPISTGIVADYVPGVSTESALKATERLVADGLRATINCLGEDTTDAAEVDATVATYLRLLADLHSRGLARHTEVSVKLSALGLALADPEAVEIAGANAHRIAAAAQRAGTMITIDMEQAEAIDETLLILRELRTEFPETGVALLAYLHRTEADCRALAFEGSRIRLCKGAYAERAEVAFQSRLDVDRSFVRCLKVLMSGQGYPMIATHDPRMIQIAASLASRHGRSRGSYEFQMLYGIRPDEQKRLAKAGDSTRIYIPYGDNWYGYLMRRLVERPENLSFVAKSLTSKK
jgi:proline dehydrogenase